jgi:hypothetical protein
MSQISPSYDMQIADRAMSDAKFTENAATERASVSLAGTESKRHDLSIRLGTKPNRKL